MRKLLAYLAAFGSLVFTCSAQTVANQPIASQFNNWRVQGNSNLAASANPQVAFTPCLVFGGGKQFNAISASTPIKIYDPGNPSVDEIVTPTSIVVTSNGCTATITPSNAHTTPWYVGSGSYGLQEAINAYSLSGQINPVILDTAWHQAGGSQQIAYNAVGNYNTPILDVTIAPSVAFRWNGTHYLATSAVNGFTATLAAGAAAGSSPTVSNGTGASGNLIVANITTGTATTTGTLFTETVGTTPNSSGNISCTAQSIGANPFPVVLTQTPASATIATFTVTVAPPVSTAYAFAISCN